MIEGMSVALNENKDEAGELKLKTKKEYMSRRALYFLC